MTGTETEGRDETAPDAETADDAELQQVGSGWLVSDRRGRCPECGCDLYSRLFYKTGHGYFVRWDCENVLNGAGNCDYLGSVL